MLTLDLHNISHLDAIIVIDEFIIKNLEELPVEIITGNSIDMQKILPKDISREIKKLYIKT